LAGRIPKPARLSLTPMLTPKGKLYGDLTVACLDEETFYLFGSGSAQEMHRRWFDQQMGNIAATYRNRFDELHGIGISGPKSQELLSRITRDDVSSEAFKFRDIRRMAVGGVPSITARLSFSGELGYEIYVAPTISDPPVRGGRRGGGRSGAQTLWRAGVDVAAAGEELGCLGFGFPPRLHGG
jgi:dimethylglycine dehydrogenase